MAVIFFQGNNLCCCSSDKYFTSASSGKKLVLKIIIGAPNSLFIYLFLVSAYGRNVCMRGCVPIHVCPSSPSLLRQSLYYLPLCVLSKLGHGLPGILI